MVIRDLRKNRAFCINADSVITVTKSFKANLIERGICAGKIFVVTNGVDLEGFSPARRIKI